MGQPTHAAPERPWPRFKRGSLLATLVAFRRDPLALLSRVIRQTGDYAQISRVHYIVNEARGAHRFLVENPNGYRKSRNAQVLRSLVGDGLLTSEGELNRRQKKLAQPAFQRGKISGFTDVMGRYAADLAREWREAAARGARVDVHEEMSRLTFRIVGACLMSVDLLDDAREFGQALRTCLEVTNRRLLANLPIPEALPTRDNRAFRKARAVVSSVIQRVVDERRRSGVDVPDLLGMLMAASDEDGRMSEKQLVDEVITLVVAGHATTAASLTFSLMLLERHPEVLARVREEAERTFGDRLPTVQEAMSLTYTRAVIDESLRLYPPVWLLTRDAERPDLVGGHPLPKDAMIAVVTYELHRNPNYFEDPERFRPERFLEPDPKGLRKQTYLPFGAGPRFCIGNHFALLEMQIVLATLVQVVDLEPLRSGPVALDASVALEPRGGFPARLRPRSR